MLTLKLIKERLPNGFNSSESPSINIIFKHLKSRAINNMDDYEISIQELVKIFEFVSCYPMIRVIEIIFFCFQEESDKQNKINMCIGFARIFLEKLGKKDCRKPRDCSKPREKYGAYEPSMANVVYLIMRIYKAIEAIYDNDMNKAINELLEINCIHESEKQSIILENFLNLKKD